VAAAALLGAACGGDDDESSETTSSETTSGGDATTAAPGTEAPGTTAAAGSDAPGTTAAGGSEAPSSDEPIKVGGIADVTSFGGIEEGARARFERANAEGGVNGRQIEFLGVEDDAIQEANSLSAARAFVQNEQVDAVLPVASAGFTAGVSDFLVQNSVPYLGFGFMPGFCGSEWGYGVNGCLINPNVVNSALVEPSIAELGREPSELRIAIQANDDISGQSGNVLYEALWEAKGAEVVYQEANLHTGTTDYTPFVQAIIGSEPDIVLVSTQFADSVALTGSLQAAGYEGMILSYIGYVPGLLEAQPAVAQAMEGTYALGQFPPQEGGGAAIEQILADLEAAGLDPFVAYGTAIGYWTADLYLQMLEAAGGDPAKVHDVVNGGFTYEGVPDGIGDGEWPELQTVAAPCSVMLKVEDAKYTVVQPYACYENIEIG
jgi:ABC-type branched-subunit amino acid transport system substrate-binding protein